MGRYILGEFEHLVLLATLQLGDEAYGVSITDLLEQQTGQEVAQAAVYLTLRRLEEKGWLEGNVGRPTRPVGEKQSGKPSTTPSAPRKGRAKKFYRLTPEGREKLAEARATLESMWTAIGEAF